MARYAGTNSIVEVTDTGGANTVAVLRSYTLPPRERSRIDVTGVADLAAVTLAGIFQISEMTITEVWDPIGNTPDFDTLIETQEVVSVKVTTTNGTDSVNSDFSGRVAALTPSEASGEAGLFRDIVIVADTKMTHSTPGP